MALRILALIPARCGSLGLRHKNIQRVAGQPLLAHAIALAQASQRHREQWSIVVSTDSPRYADIAREHGAEVPFLRPKRLAAHTSRLSSVVIHAITTLRSMGREFDVVVMLSATTPLTTPLDVRRAVALWRRNHTAVLSVTADTSAPSWRFALRGGRLIADSDRRVGRRQQAPIRYLLNGALYVASPHWVVTHGQFFARGSLGLVMPKSRSLDIETADDLHLCRHILRATHGLS